MKKKYKIKAIFLIALMLTVFMTVSVSAAGTAQLLDIDKTTRGNWVGNYGSEGYIIITDDDSLQSVPAYAKLDYINENDDVPSFWTWYDPEFDIEAMGSPDDDAKAARIPSALYKSAAKNSAIAACYYSGDFFIVTVDIGSETKLVSLYTTDFDEGNREAEVTITDESGKALTSPIELIDYEGGWYLKFKMSGKVNFMFEKIAGPNAVISGIFFDPDPDAVAAVIEEPAAVVQEEAVAPAPAPIEAAPVVDAPAPAPAVPAAPRVGDTGTVILLGVMLASGVVIFRKKVVVK